jgi:medium-chain acyl-[acyl-carrier-protein] hydrolase
MPQRSLPPSKLTGRPLQLLLVPAHRMRARALTTSPWLTCSNRQASLRLFCFPYAGGGANIFRTWQDNLPPTVEVCPVQLPGREKRLLEPPFTNLRLLVEAARRALLPYLDRPFAFFGHSMGATISFELARSLYQEQNLNPVHLFVSGRRAPQLPETHALTYDLPQKEFLEELRRLKGTPAEILEHPELMELMLPLLRADFELVQTYHYLAGPPQRCPITAFGGLHDEEVSRADLEAWREQTTTAFSLHMLPGDHFFLHTAQPPLLKTLALELREDLSRIG